MLRLPAILLAVLLAAGCATPSLRIDTTYISANQDSRAQYLVLHYTEGNFPRSLDILTRGGKVSSHYLVNSAPPTVYRLVDENRRAWHAGVSSWQGQTQLNAASIGIEIVHPGYRDTPEGRVWLEYPPAQIDAVLELCKQIVKAHKIRPDRVVGHSDIAPQRKIDPGPRFPWQRFADAGLIVWPDLRLVAQRRPDYERVLPDVEWFQRKLAQHGFAVPENGELDAPTINVIAAFQMKYRNTKFDGVPDAETAAILDVLTSPK